METDVAEVAEKLPDPCSFKIHFLMCTELLKLVDRISRIYPEIEATCPRSSAEIQSLCLLNCSIEKAKLLLQYCSESSKLYQAVTGDVMVLRFQRLRSLLEQNLGHIQTMFPVMLAVEISQIMDDLRSAKFSLDSSEEEAGTALRGLLQHGASTSDSFETSEVKAIQYASSTLHITSQNAILIEKQSIKKLIDKVSDSEATKKKILKYLLYLLKKYGNLVLEDQLGNTCVQHEGAVASENRRKSSVHSESDEVEKFRCPISSRLMYDPVVIASGQTFERMWIQRWFDEGNDTCPKTKNKLDHLSLTPNMSLKDLISEWCMRDGVTVTDPTMKPEVLHTWESSSVSSASSSRYMDYMQLQLDLNNFSSRSLVTSFTSDSPCTKIADGLSLTSMQSKYEHKYPSRAKTIETDLIFLSELAELEWESQCEVVEGVKRHLNSTEKNYYYLSYENFVEPLDRFLKDAFDRHDMKAQKTGSLLLFAFVHFLMCTELLKLVDSISRIFPKIEAARPRCSNGMRQLCMLNLAIEKAKLLLQYCCKSSKLYLAVTGDIIVSRFQRSRSSFEQSLGQIQTMVPVMLAVEISQIMDDLRSATFSMDSSEEEAGKALRGLLQHGASTSDSFETSEVKAIQYAVSTLQITSQKAILIAKRSIKKLLDRVGDSEATKKKILKTGKNRSLSLLGNDPTMKPEVFHSWEMSSNSIASFGSSMNDIQLQLDFSNMSLGSLDTSYTSDSSHPKILDGLSLMSMQTKEEHKFQSHATINKTDLKFLSNLAELEWESQCEVVEEVKRHLNYSEEDYHSLSSENFVEPLVRFLKDACDRCDIKAQKTGSQLLLAFVSKNSSGISYLREEAYNLLETFLNSEDTEEALVILEVLSGYKYCRAKILASGALTSILKMLDSHSSFQERIIKILFNMSSSSNICPHIIFLQCIPKLIPFLGDSTLAGKCAFILKNLCDVEEARVSIAETSVCIASVTALLVTGSHEDQENALTFLLLLCSQRVQYCQWVMEEGVIPALVDISINGNEKGRVSALELLQLLTDIEYAEDRGCSGSDIDASKDTTDLSKEKKSSKTSGVFAKIPMFSKKK